MRNVIFNDNSTIATVTPLNHLNEGDYTFLVAGSILTSVGSLGDFHQYLPPKILPGFRCSWNPIWSHRLAIEIACRLSEDGDYGTFLKPLIKYRDEYEKMYSTMPLCSNKSISHYVGLCALDALLKNVNEKHISRLAVIFNQVVKDGAFTGERPGKWLKGPFLRK